MKVYVVTRISPFDYQEFVDVFNTLEAAQALIKTKKVQSNYTIWTKELDSSKVL